MSQLREGLPYLKSVATTYQRISGQKGAPLNHSPLILLHGFMGNKMNLKRYALDLSGHLKMEAFNLDARNHGENHPHCLPMNYDVLTNDLEEFISERIYKDKYYDEKTKVNLFGYSMGAKTAMNFALRHPERVNKLVILDNAPISQPVDPTVRNLTTAVQFLKNWFDERYTVKTSEIRNWKIEGLKILKERFSFNDNICFYILSSLKKSKSKIVHNTAEYIYEDAVIDDLGDFPEHNTTIPNKTLIFRAKQSDMINANGVKKFEDLFPNHEMFTFDTDHESLLVDYKDTIVKKSVDFLH